MYARSESFVEALFRAHYANLCAFARHYVGCEHAAEDIVQDVFAQLWASRGDPEAYVSPKRYLYAAVRNGAFNYLTHARIMRRSHAMMRSTGRAPGMSQAPISADEEVEAAELEEAYDQAVDHLPPRCQEAYIRRNAGMTYVEIGVAMDTTARTAETQVVQARRRLRHELAVWL